MDNPTDKSTWPNGPWFEEPDKAFWRDPKTGYFCSIKRSPLGSLCGYVYLPRTHPAYLGTYDYIDIEVHGGLTYGQESGKFFKVGFDCAHFMDLVPGLQAIMKASKSRIPGIELLEELHKDHYWTWKEVKLEVESLASQLKEMEEGK